MSARDELARDIFIADNHRDPNATQEWDAFRDIGGLCGGDYAQVADRLTAKGYRKPRTITTVEELDALPEGSVVMGFDKWEGAPIVSTKRLGDWSLAGSDNGYQHAGLDQACDELTVLHDPEAEATR